jgi:hypothetical protein
LTGNRPYLERNEQMFLTIVLGVTVAVGAGLALKYLPGDLGSRN